MGVSCVAINCTARHGHRNNSDVQFHRFPLKNVSLMKKWLIKMKRDKWLPNKHSWICSKHFLDSDYKKGRKGKGNKLKGDAVPSIFDFPDGFKAKIKPRREIHRAIIEPVDAYESTSSSSSLSDPHSSSSTQSTSTQTNLADPQVLRLKKKLKVIRNRNYRMKKKIHVMEDLLKELKKKNICNGDLTTILEENFKDTPIEGLLKSQINNQHRAKKGRRYSAELRQFALTLHFYSPRAYKFVQKYLYLPHKSLLTKWIGSVGVEPGILTGVLQYLKESVEEKPFLRNVSLVFDGMSIRKQIVYDEKRGRMIGNVDLGGILPEDEGRLASEALVFQVVSYSTPFKVPIAYLLIDKVNSDLLQQIISSILIALEEVGVTVTSLTSDGCPSNLAAYKRLGCQFEEDNMVCQIPHPTNGKQVFVFADPCHMLKLARNALADLQKMESEDGEINWKFILELHKLQEELGLKFANKLSGRHVFYKNKIMSVSLAAQTMSSGVADALDYLRKAGHPLFQASEATIIFLRHFDRLFDILNSRSTYGKGYKEAIKPSNLPFKVEQLQSSAKYIRSLKADGVSILKHRRKTFALGFLINIHSIVNLSAYMFNEAPHPLRYFLGYKISQDHLELTFNCIRGHGGWNNNPNVRQLKTALQKMLLRNYVAPSANGNCHPAEEDVSEMGIFPVCIQPTSTNTSSNSDELSCFLNYNNNEHAASILQYIAGYIVRKEMNGDCVHCKNLLDDDETPCTSLADHNYCKVNSSDASAFTRTISRGGLLMAQPWVLKTIQLAEASLQREKRTNGLQNQNFRQKIFLDVGACHVERMMPYHPVVTSWEEDLHETSLIKRIVKRYINIRIRAIARQENLNIAGNRCTIRTKLNKLILFNNV